MAYETKFTRLTPAADLSLESIELQVQQKLELEQLDQYLKENYPQETELHLMKPDVAIEAFGHEMLHTIAQNKRKIEEKKRKEE